MALFNRELALYIVFMSLFFVSSISNANSGRTPFWMSQLIQTDFLGNEWDIASGGQKSFAQISRTADIYDYVKWALLPALLVEQYANGTDLPPNARFYPHQQRLLGIRLRQLRVQPDTCTTPAYANYKAVISRPCFGPWDDDNEDMETFTGVNTGDEYQWSSAKENGEASYMAKLYEYPGSGYVVDFPLNLSEAKIRIDTLRSDLWISERTRSVFVDFQTYNEAADLFLAGRTIIEIPAAGGLRPHQSVKALGVPFPTTWVEWLGAVADVLILTIVLYWTYQELQEFKTLRLKYFRDYWNVFDVTNITLFIISYAIKLAIVLTFWDVSPLKDYPTYSSIWTLAKYLDWANLVSATNALLLWIKILKYLKNNKQVMFIVLTLYRSRKELFYFGVVFFVVLISFGHAGYLAFSGQAENFRSVTISFASVTQSTSGDFDATAIEDANRFYGPIYANLFQFMMVVILLNMFLAIMNTAYMEVREDLIKERELQKKRMVKHFSNLVVDEGNLSKKQQRVRHEAAEKIGARIRGWLARRRFRKTLANQAKELKELDQNIKMLEQTVQTIAQLKGSVDSPKS